MINDLTNIINDYFDSLCFTEKDKTIEVMRDDSDYPFGGYIRKKISRNDITHINVIHDNANPCNIICYLKLHNDNYEYRMYISLLSIINFLYCKIEKLQGDTYNNER